MSDDESKEDNVIALPPQPVDLRPKGDVPFRLLVNDKSPWCDHGAREVDSRRRTVTCKRCGALLDAFDVLHEVARDHVRFAESLNRAKIDCRAAEARIQFLKRMEDNARSRLKRLGVQSSRDHQDALLAYARANTKVRRRNEAGEIELVPADLSATDLEEMLQRREPLELLVAGVAALEKAELAPALALCRRAVDELQAAVEVVVEERRRA